MFLAAKETSLSISLSLCSDHTDSRVNKIPIQCALGAIFPRVKCPDKEYM
jgi:hypothetical protein